VQNVAKMTKKKVLLQSNKWMHISFTIMKDELSHNSY